MGMSVAEAGLLATIVVAPITMGLKTGTVACGALGTVGKFISKRLSE